MKFASALLVPFFNLEINRAEIRMNRLDFLLKTAASVTMKS